MGPSSKPKRQTQRILLTSKQVNMAVRDSSTGWYTDSTTGVTNSLDEREKNTNWYTDSAKGVVDSLGKREKADTDWYADSAEGISESIQKREKADTDWYIDSASGIATEINGLDDNTDWYADSASGISKTVTEEPTKDDSNWYQDSAVAVVESLEERGEETDWYTDSALGVSKALNKRDDDSNWYADSAQGVASSLEKRKMDHDRKEAYELDLRRWIYNNMRGKSLRETSERGKALFQFDVKPRHDEVDRWHVPKDLHSRYDHAKSDAERVSVLNYYLMVTGREPKSAQELGFTPTALEPGLVEENEVGYGYALAGQHQYHCVDFVADAIDIGKAHINDFYLKHTIHCLGLLKYLAPNLTMKQPLAFLRSPANERIKAGYAQKIG